MADVYVHLREGSIHRSESFGLDILVDYDEQGAILGVEILGAEDVTIDGSLALPAIQHHPHPITEQEHRS